MNRWKQYPEDCPKERGYYLRFTSPLQGTSFAFYDGHGVWMRRIGDKKKIKVSFWMDLPEGPSYFNDCPQSLDVWPFYNKKTISLLRQNGIHTLNELTNCTPQYLLSLRGIGESKVQYLKDCLESAGFKLDK